MSTPTSGTATGNGVKLFGEALLPGTSQFIDGNIQVGALHLVGAVAIGMVGGPIGVLGSLLVRANSYSSSVAGKNVVSALVSRGGGGDDEPAPEAEAETAPDNPQP